MIDTTEGPLVRKSVQVAWPIVLQAFLVNFYAFNDYFFVGKLNDPDATAALSSCFALIIIQYFWVRILPSGATTLVAQYTGAKNTDRVASIFRQSLIASTIFSFGLGIIAWFGMDQIVAINNVTPGVGRYIAEYMFVIMFCAPAFAIMLVVIGAFRARGDTKVPLFLEFISLIANVVLNYALVLGNLGAPEMGVAGAAIATAISRVLPGLLGLVLIFRGHLGFSPLAEFSSWIPRLPDLKKMVNIGLFDSMSSAIYGIAYLVLNRMAGEIGPAAQGGLGAGLRGIEWIAFAFGDGFMTAAITIVGQNIGANQPGRALRGALSTALMSAATCQIVAFAFLLFPRELSALVTNDPATLDFAVTYVFIIGWFMWAVGFEMALYGAFVGAGQTRITFALGLFCNLGRIPLACALLFGFEHTIDATIWASFGVGHAPEVTGTFAVFAWTIGITAIIKACFYGAYLGIRRRF